MFYNGQVYDAYTFVSDLIKSAKKRIVLIDNYVDETVQTLLNKRDNNVSAIIYTQQISRQFQLDIDRHNAQYAPIDVETFRLSHDRFLCIDDDVYHIGASIKDLGKSGLVSLRWRYLHQMNWWNESIESNQYAIFQEYNIKNYEL